MDEQNVSLEDFLRPDQILAQAEKIQNFVEAGKTVQEALTVPQHIMAAKYTLCHRLVEDRSYRDAANILIYLVVLNPFDRRYWMTLGLCSSLADDEAMGIDCYTIASLIDSDDPLAHISAALSYLSLGEEENAKKALDLAAPRAKGGEWEGAVTDLKAAIGQDNLSSVGRRLVLACLVAMKEAEAEPEMTQSTQQAALYQSIKERLSLKGISNPPGRMLYFCEHLKRDHASNIVAFALSFLGKIAENQQNN